MTLGEFVKQLAALLQRDKVTMPFKNERAWHELFYALKRDQAVPGKPQFLESLRFDWDGPYPKSRDLSQFLEALHWNASVSASNPQFEVITLPEEVAELWLRRYDDGDPELKGFLDAAVGRARQEFANTVNAAYA